MSFFLPQLDSNRLVIKGSDVTTESLGLGIDNLSEEQCAKVQELVFDRALLLKKLPNLERFSNLTSLRLDCCNELKSLEGIGSLSLKNVSAINCMQLENIDDLSGMPLETLDLTNSINLKTLRVLSCFKKTLTNLSLEGIVRLQNDSSLKELVNLKYLNIKGTTLASTFAAHPHSLPIATLKLSY